MSTLPENSPGAVALPESSNLVPAESVGLSEMDIELLGALIAPDILLQRTAYETAKEVDQKATKARKSRVNWTPDKQTRLQEAM